MSGKKLYQKKNVMKKRNVENLNNLIADCQNMLEKEKINKKSTSTKVESWKKELCVTQSNIWHKCRYNPKHKSERKWSRSKIWREDRGETRTQERQQSTYSYSYPEALDNLNAIKTITTTTKTHLI